MGYITFSVSITVNQIDYTSVSQVDFGIAPFNKELDS
jgi:hypothetical protein